MSYYPMNIKSKSFSIYLILLHAFVALVLVKSDFITRVGKTIGLQNTPQELTSHYYEMLAYHKRMDGSVPDNAIIFIGDSITQSLAVSAITPSGVNYGIGKDTSIGVLNRITQYSSIPRANIVVIAIGINDLKRRDVNSITDNYTKIINAIPKDIQIIFNAVHPVNEFFSLHPGRKNAYIQQLNLNLKSICSKFTNVHFMDISQLLADNRQNLSNKFHTGDGIHLNHNGYAIWINSLKEMIIKLKGTHKT